MTAARSAYLSDVGRTRSENQDACQEFCDAAGARLLVVADGMGGHQGGATASRMAIEATGEVFSRAGAPRGSELLREAVQSANERVYETASRHAELRGMGTTLVAFLFEADGSNWVAHVGDSRAYRLRDGRLEAMTADHSAVAELQRRGLISSEEAAVHPRRNELLRSVGVEPNVEVDVAPFEARPGDRFLLCSDGLSGVLSEEEIRQVLATESPERAVRRLIDTANDCGGPDNVTVMITEIPAEAAPAFAAPDPGSPPRRSKRSLRRVRRIAAAAAIVSLLLIGALLLLLTGEDLRWIP